MTKPSWPHNLKSKLNLKKISKIVIKNQSWIKNTQLKMFQ